MNIRSAVLADEPDIARLVLVLTPAAHKEHQSDNNLSLLLNSSDHRVWVAEAGESVVGWLHAYAAIRVGKIPFIEIGGLIVDEEHRREGAGSRLVDEALVWARAKGLAVRVRSNSKRIAAHKFYQAKGFQVLKRQHVFELDFQQVKWAHALTAGT